MREYGQIQTAFWTHHKIKSLPMGAKILAVYLLSSRHTTSLGCFYLPTLYIRSDLNMSEDETAQALKDLEAAKFAYYDHDLEWILIRDFLEWNRIANQSVAKYVAREFEAVPAAFAHWGHLVQALEDHGRHMPHGFDTVLQDAKHRADTVPTPCPHKEKEQEQEKEPPPTPPAGGSEGVLSGGNGRPNKRKAILTRTQQARFDEFYRQYPRREDPGAAEKAWAKIDDDSDIFVNFIYRAILNGVARYQADIDRNPRPRNKIKLPATWLNARAWESDYGGDDERTNPYAGL